MKCYNCDTELIWGGDHDCEEDEDHLIVSNLSCPNCNAFIVSTIIGLQNAGIL